MIVDMKKNLFDEVTPSKAFFSRLLLPEFVIEEMREYAKGLGIIASLTKVDSFESTFPGTFDNPRLLSGGIKCLRLMPFSGLEDYIEEARKALKQSAPAITEHEALKLLQAIKTLIDIQLKISFPEATNDFRHIIPDFTLLSIGLYNPEKKKTAKYIRAMLAIFALGKLAQFVADQATLRRASFISPDALSPRWHTIEADEAENADGAVTNFDLLFTDPATVATLKSANSFGFYPRTFTATEPLLEAIEAIRAIDSLDKSSILQEMIKSKQAMQVLQIDVEERQKRAKAINSARASSGGKARAERRYGDFKRLVISEARDLKRRNPGISDKKLLTSICLTAPDDVWIKNDKGEEERTHTFNDDQKKRRLIRETLQDAGIIKPSKEAK
jgi:hypothetical protein